MATSNADRSDTESNRLHELLTTECLASVVPCSGCGCEVGELVGRWLRTDGPLAYDL